VTTVVDWRDAPSEDVVPLVEAEAKAWLRSLHWDVADAWHVIEPARLAGQLPGAIVLDDRGRPSGWTAYLRHGASVQVMAVVACSEAATRALLDQIMTSPEAESSAICIVCVREGSPGLIPALGEHGFAVEPYRYLVAPLDRFSPGDESFDPWPDSDEDVARLFARAYEGDEAVRAFAPTGALPEWIEYVAQLRKGPGCGWYQGDLCFAWRDPATGEPGAAILVTHLGPGTVHIAQLAVDPAVRRRGLARRLVRTALGRATGRFERATLLVSAANRAGGALYESFGFEETARFIVATKRSASQNSNRTCA
jgi:ribosomal protein S18 acetylase RimI-like enzyme